MITKKSLIYILLVIALILALFSVGMTLYVQSQSSDSQTLDGDLGGNVNLVILPTEQNSTIAQTG
ncbi:MAG TPA: hypothetical protein VHA12_03570 [Candidatus Nanoarchaeia archaeon]|nr:hypothetical protein [Candidatus Nanoarchaeia archaeon]